MMRYLPVILFTLLAMMLFTGLVRQQQNDLKQMGLLMDQPMPELPLVAADNSEAPLKPSSYEGRVTLVNFLASWCAPCEVELVELAALKTAYPTVEFYAVAWNDAPARIRPWLKEHGDPFNIVRYDPRGRAAIALGVRGIPETFIIDARGIVRFQHSGPITASLRKQKVGPLMEQLLDEASEAQNAR
jgi:cytochrome c biogenesis protein CcmG/thiol:disulfide interchange protein DsbE